MVATGVGGGSGTSGNMVYSRKAGRVAFRGHAGICGMCFGMVDEGWEVADGGVVGWWVAMMVSVVPRPS